MICTTMESRRVLNVFVLAMINVSIMASLRNFPLVAQFGLSAIFFFLIVALFFLIPSALVSAELATGWPKEGGIYIWVREAFGDKWGFFAIWMQWVHNVAWYPVILSFVGSAIAYIFAPHLAQNALFIFAVILVGFWGMTLFNFLGIKSSGWFSTFGVIAGTIIPGSIIILLGFAWLVSSKPIAIPTTPSSLFPSLHALGDLVFLAGLFLSFSGMEVSAAYASDVKNPQKNYPRAIVLGATITFILVLLGSLSIAIIIPREKISLVAGVLEAFELFFTAYHIPTLVPIMAGLLIIGAIAEVNSWVIGPVRGLHATSIHGNLPPLFQKVNNQQVPTALLIFQALIVTITSFAFLYMPTVSSAFWILTALSAQSYLIMYILLFLTGLKLRYTKPHVPRTYRVPFEARGMWFFCSIALVTCVFAIALGFVPPSTLPTGSLIVYILILAISLFVMCGIPLWIYSRRKPTWKQVSTRW